MMDSVLDILLRTDIPEPQTKRFKSKRLSRLCGEDVIFTLKELGFSRVAEIKNLHSDTDIEIHIVLAGMVEPNLKDKSLLGKYSAATPAELVKKMLRPGEITDISCEIEKLSGFRIVNLEHIDDTKKN